MKNEIQKFATERLKYWWTSLLVGIVAILLGVIWFLTPISAILTLTYLFVIGFFLSGIAEIVFASTNRKTYVGWGWTLVGGIIDILFSVLLFTMPIPIITTMFIYFVGFWLLFRSIWTIGAAAEMKGTGGMGWLLALGILSLIFSIFYLYSPIYGGMLVLYLASFAFIFYGIFRIYYAFRLKSVYKKRTNKLEN